MTDKITWKNLKDILIGSSFNDVLHHDDQLVTANMFPLNVPINLNDNIVEKTTVYMHFTFINSSKGIISCGILNTPNGKGDVVEFDTPKDAVLAALEIRNQLKNYIVNNMPPCSRRAFKHQECPIIDFPEDKEEFMKKFLELTPKERYFKLGCNLPEKKLKKARKRSDIEKIYDTIVKLRDDRYLDFSS